MIDDFGRLHGDKLAIMPSGALVYETWLELLVEMVK